MADDLPDPQEAVWFGRGEARAFGMLHRPVEPGGHGVVVCNTLGFEGLLAHRPLRHLAADLAATGHTVLRLDYTNTGDAAGDGSTPPSVESCVTDVLDAIALLTEQHGCTSISLVGIRAGATVAALVGLRHPGLRDLVLWVPCDRGSAYVRELKALARLSNASRPGSPPPVHGQELEVVGFEYGAVLLNELSAIDLTKAVTAGPTPVARRVLLLERGDVGDSSALVEALKGSGTDLDQAVAPQWAEFMVSDETQSAMPQVSLDRITAWLGDSPAPDPAEPPFRVVDAPADGPALVVAATYAADGVTERTTWITDRLFAIVTEPAPPDPTGPSADPGAGAPGVVAATARQVVVMPNTGSVNRTGPGRLYTHLARSWAALGMVVVRVDLGGTGDSATLEGQPENQPYSPARIAELLDVIGWAHATLSPVDLSLYGICSGAFQSFHAALMGADVQRAILVNPTIFYLGPDQTVSTSTSKAMIASHNVWRLRFIRTQVARAVRSPGDLVQFARRAGRGLAYTAGAWWRRGLRRLGVEVAEREHLDRDLRRLAADKVNVLFVFAAGEPGLRYLNVFGSKAIGPNGDPATANLVEIDGGDHVFSPPVARRAMTTAVTQHLAAVEALGPHSPAPQG